MFDLESGARRLLAAIEGDRPTTRLDDGRLDRRGRLVFGTMDEDPAGARPLGHIWSFGDRGSRVLASGVRIANSITFSPDGRRMYFADTPEKRIRVYDYDLDSGVLSGERVFATVDGPGLPDGSTVDADGCLWNAEWGGGRVVRYAPDGRVIRVLPLPASQVTCCAFGGAGLDRLFVTTARTGSRPLGACRRTPCRRAVRLRRRRHRSCRRALRREALNAATARTSMRSRRSRPRRRSARFAG